MAATKRRHSTTLVAPKPDAPAADAKQREEGNARLIALCVEILSAHHPRGMTTKELIGELDKQTERIPNLTSSILSTKLNAMFRKSHGDSANPSPRQLAELPLVRRTSTDLPKRLVYTFAGEIPQTKPISTKASKGSKNTGTGAKPGSDDGASGLETPESDSEPKRRKLDEQPTPEASDEEPAVELAQPESTESESTEPAEPESAAPASPVSLHGQDTPEAVEPAEPAEPAEPVEPTEPTEPTEPIEPVEAVAASASSEAAVTEAETEATEPSAETAEPADVQTAAETEAAAESAVEAAEPEVTAVAAEPEAQVKSEDLNESQPKQLPEEPKELQAASRSPLKAKLKAKESKVNLYYDTLGVDGLTNALPTPAAESPAFDLDFTSEFAPPEDLSFELDGFGC